VEGITINIFSELLKRNRERYNTKFALARHTYPALDGEAFGEHLKKTVAPIAEAVAENHADKVDVVTDSLYDLSLELIGKDFFGKHVRYPAMLDGWEILLPFVPHLLAKDANTLTSAITNALYNLSVEPTARPSFWIETMIEIGKLCDDVQEFLEAGKVVAWRSGLAHYREGALEACKNLKTEIACAALGINETQNLETLLAQIEKDPWLNPQEFSSRLTKEKRLRAVSVVGAFRGFGGLFIAPPKVTYTDGQFLIYDSENLWAMTADCFGATFHRMGQTISGLKNESNPNFRIDKQGRVEMNEHRASFHHLADGTSFAADETTLAVTLPLSHSVYLIAMS
jgi:hypothetical protein